MKTYIFILSTFLTTILFLNCANEEIKVEPEFNLHAADFFNQMDYNIYNLVLEEYYSDSALIIIRQQIDYNLPPIAYHSGFDSGDYYNYIKLNMPEIDTIAFLNFLSNNDTISYLDNLFKVNKSTISLFSEEKYDYLFDRNKDTWKLFYAKYPNSNGLIELSRIGYNDEVNQAILEIWHAGGWTGGKGVMYFLSKKNNTWVITKTKETRTN